MRILLGDEGKLARSLLEGQIAMAETGRRTALSACLCGGRRVLGAGALVIAFAGHLGCGKQDGDGGTGGGAAEESTGSVFAGLEAGPKKSALEHARAVARAHYARALALDKKEKFEKSVEDYTGAIEALAAHVEGAGPELKADLALAYYRRGIAHDENGDHASAAADDYKKALELAPGNAQAHYRRGAVFARTGEYEGAIGAFDKALELDAGLTQVYSERGAAYGEQGKHDKAIADLTKALEVKGAKAGEARMYKRRGAAYAAKGEHDKAVADFTKALALKKDDAEALYDRGLALAAKGEHGEAIADYTKAIELKKDDAALHKSRAEAYAATADYDKSVADYTTAIKLDPADVEMHISRAAACARKGDYAGAVGFYTKTLEVWPNSTEAQNNLAWILASCADGSCRDGRRAVELAEKAARLSTRKNAAYLDTLAAAYAEAGRFGDAVKVQREAVSLSKDEKETEAYKERLGLYGQGKPYRAK